MKSNKSRKQNRRNRRRLVAEPLEQRRLLAVDTWVLDFDLTGNVDLYGPTAAGDLENAFGENSQSDGNVVATSNPLGLNNRLPVIDSIGNQTVDELATLNFTATATDSDVPAQPLTFSLGGSVPTGASITAGGDFSWTPTEAQGPGVFTFDVIVSDGPSIARETISVTVNELNVAPVLDSIGNQVVDEHASLSFTATATDVDQPDNALTFSLGGAVPAGASITPGGVFSWTPSESQGPGVYIFDVVVTDDGTGSLSDSETITVVVNEANAAPELDAIGNKVIDELASLSFTATASDVDTPPNLLTFSLSGTVPAGASISPAGVFTWVPTEAQGSGTFTFDVVVTDNGVPNLSDSETIQVTVNEVNVPPELNLIGNPPIDELTTLSFTATATDADTPANGLTFSLAGSVPTGATITPAGAFSWTPTEDQGPGSFTFDVVVTDDGTPNLSDSETITVSVNETNAAPVLDPIGTLSVDELNPLTFTATASDTDNPADNLTFSLAGSVPTGAGITTSGDFSWTPTEAQSGTFSFDVVVTDDGTPNLSDSETITVNVGEVNLPPVIISNGGGATASINLDENTTSVTTVTATDPDLPTQSRTFSITGGADQALFSIVSTTGVLTFNNAADFENPTDAGNDNVYDVQVTVTDSGSLTDVQDIAVTVTDVNDPPVITSLGGGATATVNAAENQTAVTTVAATDEDSPQQDLTFSISGGADQTAFDIVAATGVLTFNAAPDFENPGDVGGDNVYDVQVTVTDNGTGTLSDVQDIAVSVTDANDPPTLTLDDNNSSGIAPDFATTFNIGLGTPTNISDSDLSIADADAAATLSSATLTISNLQDAPDETLSATPSGSILAGDINYSAATGVLTIAKVASLTDYRAVLASVTYDNNASAATLSPARNVTFVVNDGTSNSNVATTTVTLLAGPLLDLDDDDSGDSGDDHATSFLEDAGAVNVTDNDVDIVAPVNITTATFVLTNRPDGSSETLSVNGPLPAGITISDPYDNSDGKLVISGSDTGAIYESVLEQIQYNNASQNPNTADRIVTVVVRDANSQDSLPATSTISVSGANDPPDDPDDTYAVQSNVGISVPANAGLLSGATDPEGNTPIELDAVSVGTFATTAGGSITTSADGSFTYTPEAGDASIADTFSYTVKDSLGLSSTSTATFNVDGNTIWFVDNTAGNDGTGKGTLSAPFKTLAALDDSGTDPDGDGDTIFLYKDSGVHNLTNDFDLQSGQRLIGDGVAGSGTINDFLGFTTHPNSLTLPGTNAAGNPSLTTTNTPAIGLNTGNTIRGIDIGNTGSGTAISGSNFGTLTIDDVNISGTGGLLDLTNGTVNDPDGGVTFTSLESTSNPGVAVALDAIGGAFTANNTTVSGGTLGIDLDNLPAAADFDFGATTISGGADAGIAIDGSNNATTAFSSLSIASDNGNGFRANNGGTIELGGSGNAIGTLGGAAIDLTSTTINNGAGGAALFSSLSSTTSGGKGIQLNNVSGDLSVASSTTILNPSNTGVDILNSSGTFSFGDLDIATSGFAGLSVSNSGTVNSTSGTINTGAGFGVKIDNTALGISLNSVSVNGAANGISLTDTSGSFTISGDGSNAGNGSGGTIQNTTGHGIILTRVANFSASSLDLSSPGDGLGDHGLVATDITGTHLFRGGRITGIGHDSGDGIRISNTNTNLTKFEINNTAFVGSSSGGNDGLLIESHGTSVMRVDVVNSSEFDSLRGDGVQANSHDSSALTVVIRDSEFNTDTGGADNGLAGGTSRISFISDGTSTLTTVVEDNLVDDTGTQLGQLPVSSSIGALDYIANGSSNLIARISGNNISGIDQEQAIRVVGDDNAASLDVIIDGNDINNIEDEDAIFIYVRDATRLANLSITNNNIGTGPDGSVGGSDNQPIAEHGIELRLQSRNIPPNSNHPIVGNLLISGNDIVNNDNNSETIDLESEVDNPDGATSNPGATLNATVTGNVLVNLGTADEAEIDSEDGPVGVNGRSHICLDFSGNTLNAGAGTVQLDEDGGATLDIVQASQAAFAAANGIPTLNVGLAGSPNFGVGTSCPQPTHGSVTALPAAALPTGTRRPPKMNEQTEAVVDAWHDRGSIDVNDDGLISGLDALLVVNALLDGGKSSIELDTNGDGMLSSSDAIRVINHLNQLATEQIKPDVVSTDFTNYADRWVEEIVDWEAAAVDAARQEYLLSQTKELIPVAVPESAPNDVEDAILDLLAHDSVGG